MSNWKYEIGQELWRATTLGPRSVQIKAFDTWLADPVYMVRECLPDSGVPAEYPISESLLFEDFKEALKESASKCDQALISIDKKEEHLEMMRKVYRDSLHKLMEEINASSKV